MNKKQKTIFTVGAVIIASSIIVWLSSGGEIFTKTQVLVEKKDELFPDMVDRQWVNKFIWGLDLSGVISLITVVLCGFFYFLFRDKKKSSELS